MKSSTISQFLVLTILITLPSSVLEGTPASIFDMAASALQKNYIRYQEPEYVTFEELETLSKNPRPRGKLARKLKQLWTTPLISNEAYYSGAKPIKPSSPKLGEFLRVITWNIEKSLHMNEVIKIFTVSDNQFDLMLDLAKIQKGSEEYQEIVRQRKRLIEADIIVLQEMEIGVKRSQYWNAAGELAKALNMNYAYGTQYLEIDPVILGLEPLTLEDGSTDQEAMNYYQVDKSKYKGMFGSAVLSKYPIKHVELHPLSYQPYDWYEGELQKVGFLEKTRRIGAKGLFKNEITREMKVGGRSYFRVDLDVPGLAEEVLTIINIHLEIKCQPKDRKIQMSEILSKIQNIRHPLIMLGDYNAASTDISTTSVARVAKRTGQNPSAWLGVALKVAGSQLNTPRVAGNMVKNFNDPFAKDIKIVAPNKLKPMFDEIKNFRFNDGGHFDLRGDTNRSVGGKSGLAANSNQRGTKGFKTSFRVIRPLGIVGKYRLDWIFVKSGGKKGSYRFSPHFGETMEEMNTSFKTPVSDHHPSVIDLPFEEPRI